MPSDVVRIICPNLRCKAILAVPASARGKAVRCRQCGSRIQVPMPRTQPAATPPADVPAAGD